MRDPLVDEQPHNAWREGSFLSAEQQQITEDGRRKRLI